MSREIKNMLETVYNEDYLLLNGDHLFVESTMKCDSIDVSLLVYEVIIFIFIDCQINYYLIFLL